MNDASSKTQMVNVAEIIKRVRKVDAQIKQMEAEFDEKLKPFKQMSEAGRAMLSKVLHDTGQRGASTPEGGCHLKTKITFQVRDRETFKKHVIESASWEMIAWRANDAVCEDYVQAHKEEPPGTYRNVVDILTVTAPAKPRLRKRKPDTLSEEEWEELGREVDEEMDALESNNGDQK